MASVTITSPLAGSFVDPSFTATGYGDPDGLMVQGSHSTATCNGDTVQGGLWSLRFNGASGKSDVSVTGPNAADSETDITVNGANPPTVTITSLVAPPRMVEGANPVSYTVGGTFDKKTKGVGVVCMVVNRVNKKIKDIIATAPAVLHEGKGTWEATLSFDAPGKGKRLDIYAVMIDGNGSSVTVSGRTTPPAA